MEVPANGAPPGTGAAAYDRRLRERVVGIVVTRGSVVPVTDLDKVPAIYASTALYHQLGHRYVAFGVPADAIIAVPLVLLMVATALLAANAGRSGPGGQSRG